VECLVLRSDESGENTYVSTFEHPIALAVLVHLGKTETLTRVMTIADKRDPHT
jgi:hypothetical protein